MGRGWVERSPRHPSAGLGPPQGRHSHIAAPYRCTIVSLPPFQHLVDEHWRDVSRLARGLVGPVHADDVAQQAWTQALAAYPRLRSTRNLRSWLLTITHRCAMDHHRTAARSDPHEDPSTLAAAPVVPPPTEPPDAELWARVAGLPDRHRDALVLRFVGDLDHRAVAAALGTTPGMSRRLVSDAVAVLRLDLVDPLDPPVPSAPPDPEEPS